MNVYDQAHNLAQAIKESEEFKQFDASRKEIKENPQLDEAVKDLMNRQFEIQAAQMMGNEPDAESMEKLQQLSAIMMQDPLAARYLQCQMRFSMMMADVYKIIGETADMGIGPAAGGENE
ncbi:MAG TPA: YlbF family regulator [Candidatus Copromorpha excrementigallinarum]|uniref:YlbF family regulator n=1 Tax=Candidatus Allocopromorpha excrementigallinarum TaxID=2840742 RepID=A0A9D1I0F1_9FIRM|nr:YlbF family regulator [Candidatus Copromorpha excrementigallinarum]